MHSEAIIPDLLIVVVSVVPTATQKKQQHSTEALMQMNRTEPMAVFVVISTEQVGSHVAPYLPCLFKLFRNSGTQEDP